MELRSLQAEVMQMALELLVHERMSRSKGVKSTQEKNKVKGRSTEEVKGKPSSSLEEDTEEMGKFEPGGDGSMLENFGRNN